MLSTRLSGLRDRDQKEILFQTAISHHLLNNQRSPGRAVGCKTGYIADVTVFDELTYWLILKLNQETVRNAKSVVVEMIE